MSAVHTNFRRRSTLHRFPLAAMLIAGKGFDAVSTIVVLPLNPSFYETQWFTRQLMAEFGLVAGTAVSAIVAVAVVALLAESGVLVQKAMPDAWVPWWYAGAIRIGTYAFAGTWYALAGLRNLSLVV